MLVVSSWREYIIVKMWFDILYEACFAKNFSIFPKLQGYNISTTCVTIHLETIRVVACPTFWAGHSRRPAADRYTICEEITDTHIHTYV